MKYILTILAIFAAAAIASAADPTVKVNSATSVTVDGVDYGKPVDAIANNPALAPAIQRALEAWAAEITTAKTEAEAALAAKSSRIASVLEAKLAAELATGDGPKAALIRELQSAAAKPAEDLKKEELAAKMAAIKAELEALKK